jgi:hypothetical protein
LARRALQRSRLGLDPSMYSIYRQTHHTDKNSSSIKAMRPTVLAAQWPFETP